MEYPIGTVVISTELKKGEWFVQKESFKRGYVMFCQASEFDARQQTKEPKEVIKMITDREEDTPVKRKILVPLYQIITGKCFEYEGKKYQATAGRWDTTHCKSYMGIQAKENDQATVRTIVPQTDEGYNYSGNSALWMNNETLVYESI